MSVAAPDVESRELGVNVAGFLRGGLGLGEAARRYVAALRSAGVPVQTTSIDVPLPDMPAAVRKETHFEDFKASVFPRFNLVCVNAPELPRFFQGVGPAFFEGKRTIGVWAWETDHVPEEWDWAFRAVDEIWTYSNYVVDVLRDRSPVPVIRMPLPVVPPAPAAAPPDLGLPDGFTFLLLFDFYSTMQRKNPLGLIEAFRRAFRPGEGPQLLVKSFNGDYKPERLEQVRRAAAGHPDVHVVDRYLPADERDALVAACDSYVSLHRSEGFGLPLAEAMTLGKPVIATGYSGNLDFMTPENSWLVRYGLTEVGPDGENYPAEGRWADPDLDHAAELMREVWLDREGARARAERGREEVTTGLSVERVGAMARERLEHLAVRGEPPVPPPPPPPVWLGWEPLQRARWKIDYDPLSAARKEGGPKGLARSAALRGMRPYTYHQEELNRAVVDGLQELAERVDRIAWELELEAGLSASGRAHARRLIEAARVRPSPDHPMISTTDEHGEPVLAFDASGEEDPHPYRSFEDVFRGSQRLIRARQEGYLELLAGRSWVLDAGCGRGEFLELLREHGIEGRGVDLDPGMVELSREKGLDVEEGDVVEHLRSLPDGSVPALFAAQLVEHLPAGVLVELLRLGARKLEPGGVAIFETVNPHRPSALKAFWVDPTHHHPLFPEVLLAFCRFAGFGSGRVMFPGGSGEFGRDVYDMPDYAVVARR